MVKDLIKGENKPLFHLLSAIEKLVGKLRVLPRIAMSALPRRCCCSTSSFVCGLSEHTCPKVGGSCGRTRRSLPHHLALLRLHSTPPSVSG